MKKLLFVLFLSLANSINIAHATDSVVKIKNIDDTEDAIKFFNVGKYTDAQSHLPQTSSDEFITTLRNLCILLNEGNMSSVRLDAYNEIAIIVLARRIPGIDFNLRKITDWFFYSKPKPKINIKREVIFHGRVTVPTRIRIEGKALPDSYSYFVSGKDLFNNPLPEIIDNKATKIVDFLKNKYPDIIFESEMSPSGKIIIVKSKSSPRIDIIKLDAADIYFRNTYNKYASSDTTLVLQLDTKLFFKISEELYGLTKIGSGNEIFGYSLLDFNVMLVNNGGDPGTVYHELFHIRTRNSARDNPMWLNEGMAFLYSSFDFKDAKFVGGVWDRQHFLFRYLDNMYNKEKKNRISIYDLIYSSASQFNINEDMTSSDPNTIGERMAMAKYFCLFAQDKGVLLTMFNKLCEYNNGGSKDKEMSVIVLKAFDEVYSKKENDGGNTKYSKYGNMCEINNSMNALQKEFDNWFTAKRNGG